MNFLRENIVINRNVCFWKVWVVMWDLMLRQNLNKIKMIVVFKRICICYN